MMQYILWPYLIYLQDKDLNNSGKNTFKCTACHYPNKRNFSRILEEKKKTRDNDYA